jgi:hypothetical protein
MVKENKLLLQVKESESQVKMCVAVYITILVMTMNTLDDPMFKLSSNNERR